MHLQPRCNSHPVIVCWQARARAGEQHIAALQETLAGVQAQLAAAQKLLAALREPERACLADLAACRRKLGSLGADLALAASMLVYGLARPAPARAKLEATWKLQVSCAAGPAPAGMWLSGLEVWRA